MSWLVFFFFLIRKKQHIYRRAILKKYSAVIGWEIFPVSHPNHPQHACSPGARCLVLWFCQQRELLHIRRATGEGCLVPRAVLCLRPALQAEHESCWAQAFGQRLLDALPSQLCKVNKHPISLISISFIRQSDESLTSSIIFIFIVQALDVCLSAYT